MRSLLLSLCPVLLWVFTAFHLAFLLLFMAQYRKNHRPIFLLMWLITIGLFYDSLILSLGEILPGGAALAAISRLRYVSHGALIPLIFPICAYALELGKTPRTVVWVFTLVLTALGIAEGFATELVLQQIAGVTRCASGSRTPAWAHLINGMLSFGTVVPLMLVGIYVWIRQKTPHLFLSGFLMFFFSAVGPATGNTDLIFFISMAGELFMVLFFYLYARRQAGAACRNAAK